MLDNDGVLVEKVECDFEGDVEGRKFLRAKAADVGNGGRCSICIVQHEFDRCLAERGDGQPDADPRRHSHKAMLSFLVRAGAKRTASRGEGLLDPCQLLLDAIQARVNGIRLGEALLEDAVEKALIRDAAVCGQFLQLGQAVGIQVDRDLHARASGHLRSKPVRSSGIHSHVTDSWLSHCTVS